MMAYWSLKADPAARLPARYGGARPISAAWAGAAGLHSALLAALILSWPGRPAAPLEQAPISLMVVQAPGVANTAVAARQKPVAAKMVTPPAPPVKVAARALARRPPTKHSVATLLPPAAKPVPAAAGIRQNDAASLSANAATVAARPIAGSGNQPPDYPDAARLHGEQGRVLLSIHVLPDGQADAVHVARSSGFKLLDQAAVAAVLKWRFQPAYQSGQALASVLPYWIYFKLVN